MSDESIWEDLLVATYRNAWIWFSLIILLVAACTTPSSEDSDKPRLINQVTIDTSATGFATAQETFIPTVEEPQTISETRIPTKTQPVKTTPPFFTNTPPATRTPTLTRTPTITITPTASNTTTPSFTPSITNTFIPTLFSTPIIPPTTFPIVTIGTSTISCPFTWFFAPAPTGCPTANPVMGSLVFQQFERGFMFWLGNERNILILHDTGSSVGWGIYPDNFVDGTPIDDPSFVPPNGMLQPIRGFGLLWRSEVTIREQLGWAVALERGYSGYSQVESLSESRYVQGPDGIIYVMSGIQGTWWRQ